MAKSGEFYTFDEVVRQLKIDENKLKRLVSEGEISAFREGDVMKFKKTEIDKLSTRGPGSETSETVLSEITLEDEAPAFEESGETLTDDLVFESSEGGADEVKLGAEPKPKRGGGEISSQDTFIEGGGGDVGMTTEPIDLSADLTQEVEEEEVEEVEAGGAARPQRTQRRVGAPAEAPAGNPGITFALILSSILVLLALALSWRTSTNEVYAENPLPDDALFRKMSNLFYDMGSKDAVKKAIDEKTRKLNESHASTVRGAAEGGQ
jgi:excisionase family DNA binding protein